jgi:hypothetical protein
MINSFSNFGNTLSQESPASLRQLHNSTMSFAQSCLRVTWSYTKPMYRRNKIMHLVVLLWMLWFVVRVVNVVTKRKAGISPTKESTIILFTLPPFFRRGILNKLWRQLICPVFFFLFFFFLIFFLAPKFKIWPIHRIQKIVANIIHYEKTTPPLCKIFSVLICRIVVLDDFTSTAYQIHTLDSNTIHLINTPTSTWIKYEFVTHQNDKREFKLTLKTVLSR